MAYSPKSQKKYNSENYKFYAIKLHKEKDQEMIEYIESHKGDSAQAFFKELIHGDMEDEQGALK